MMKTNHQDFLKISYRKSYSKLLILAFKKESKQENEELYRRWNSIVHVFRIIKGIGVLE